MLIIKTLLLSLSVICIVGGISGWEGPLGDNPLLAIGASAMLAHTAVNPNLHLRPFKCNTFAKGKAKWLGRLGLFFLILGLIDASGALDIPSGVTIV